jgi:transposase-like protein
MAQHFLLSKDIRDLSVPKVIKMSDDEIRTFFQVQRWGCADKQGCPSCGVFDSHKFRAKRCQWRCKSCEHEFSVTSNTLFADRKISLRTILLAFVYCMVAPNAISSIQLSMLLDVQHKTAFVLLGKLRECVFITMDRSPMEGVVEIDGGHFGGKPRRPNLRKKPNDKVVAEIIESGGLMANNRRKKRSGMTALNIKKLKNRRIVLVLRLRSDELGRGAIRTFTWVGKAESDEYVRETVMRMVKPDSLIVSDEGQGFSALGLHYAREVVAHSQMYCTPEGVNQNQAESFMSRLRRMEIIYHGYHGPKYLADYAAYAARLEDDRRKTIKERVTSLLTDALNCGKSQWWRGYFQGKMRDFEILCDQLPVAA